MRYILIIMLCVVSLLPVTAQDNMITIQLTGAYEITIPEDWEINLKTQTGFYWTTQNSIVRIRTYTPGFLASHELRDPTMTKFFEWLIVDVFESRDFAEDALVVAELGEYDGFTYHLETIEHGSRTEYQFYGYEHDYGTIVLGYISSLDEGETSEDDTSALIDALSTVSRSEAYTYYDGTSFEIDGSGWEVINEDMLGIAWAEFRTGATIVIVGYYPRYAAIAGFENPRDFLSFVWSAVFSDYGRFDRSKVEDSRMAGYDAIYYPIDSTFLNSRDMYNRGAFIFTLTQNRSYVIVKVMTEEVDTDYSDIYSVIDTFSPGNRIVCPLFASSGISIREQPTTQSDRVRQTSDEALIAEYDTIGSDGYRWFNVGDGWVRSDVIFFEINTCEGLPRK